MLLEQTTRPVTSIGIMQTAKATIKATPKIFSFFADQTYSNKPVAITRELVANAIDAHTAAGVSDVPVEVWLPTDFDPTYRVRDQGIGMAHDFVMGPFMAYTDGSTKDNANDQIGGFGIGSKSPFAYTDQFTLRSVHQGTVSIYSMFIDEEGIPSVGLLGQKQTNEANGVEVSFPVKSEDFGTFANAANEALKYFHPQPIVHNGTIDAPDYIARGNNWAMRRLEGDLAIIMGGVKYDTNYYNLSYELRGDEKLSPLIKYGLDLTLPIGACGVALSRESLSYNEKTEAGIRAALEGCLDEIVSSFSTMFDYLPTLWDAKKALAAELPQGMSHGARGKLLLGNAFYRGKPLVPEVKFLSGTTWQIDAKSRGRRRGQGKCPSAKWEGVTQHYAERLDRFEHVIIDDLPQSPTSRTIQRIKTFVDDECNRDKPILILRDVKFDTTIPASEFILTSSLDVPEKIKVVKGDRPKVRMFKCDRNVGKNFRKTYNSGYHIEEVDYNNQPQTGILVVGDNFDISSDDYRMLQTQLVTYEECHFVNISDGAKLKWPRLADVFQARLAAILDQHHDLPHALQLHAMRDLNELVYNVKRINLDDIPANKRNSPFAQLLAMRDRYITPLTGDQMRLAQFMPEATPLKIPLDAFKTKQPKAHRLLELLRDSLKPNTFDYNFFMGLL
jgi:hypothetical protein